MKLYNTLTRKLEDFVPLSAGKVTFYHCGPTVYWTQHIGNLRGMTMGDILVRTLRRFGYDVTHVRNYTDVGHLTSDADTGEDKMEKGAKREGLTPDAIAQKYIAIFEEDTKALHLVEPSFKPRPSKLIPEILTMVQTLVDKGFAYVTDLAVYFDVSKFPTYTMLSRQKLEKSVGGAGKGDAEDPGKKHFADFALWIFKKGSHANALQTWDSSWGVGFPGWHIECSVMAKKYLGDTIDIHMGGVEHIPIHHTNEIAQSESANGVPFVRYWLHNEHLVVNQEKMAKSAGTGLSLSEVMGESLPAGRQGFDPLALRYFYLTAHYRTRQNFTWEALEGAQNALKELRAAISNIPASPAGRQYPISNRNVLSEEKLTKVDEYRRKFDSSLANDLNTPQALAVLWEVAKSNIPSQDKYDFLMDVDEVLGLQLNMRVTIPDDIVALGKKIDDLRKGKNYKEADALRAKIIEAGYGVETTQRGTVISPR